MKTPLTSANFFSINAVGTDGYISCVETQNSAVSRMLKSAGKRRGVTGYIGEDTRRRLFELGVSLRIAPKIFKRTTMVVFSTLCNCESASSAHTCDASKYAEEIYTYDDKENC